MKNMQRRDFLKLASALSASKAIPVGLGIGALAQQAHADSPNYAGLNITAPTVMPQVINVFMYGGASELAGNLSNIEDINTNSENPYTDNSAFRDTILQNATDNDPANRSRFNDGQITANDCWKEAGGTHMEDMLDAGDMAIYRTIYKQKSPTRSHRESIFMSHKGTLDIENSPGIGSRLALMLKTHEAKFGTVPLADGQTVGGVTNAAGTVGLEAFTLPFVSFEGDSQTYALDPLNPMPLALRGLTMDNNFTNPYTRPENPVSEDAITSLLTLRETQISANASKYSKAFNGFKDRAALDSNMDLLRAQLGLDGAPSSSAEALGVPLQFSNNTRAYPNTTFGRQMEAAITLAIHNPQTLYMAVGTPGLGGWDDHNNGIDRYPDRMNELMEAIKVGMHHISLSKDAPTLGDGSRTRTDNIIINVFGDFGRLVNLNNSGGWDHANNQNLYTFGGVDKADLANSVRPPKEAAAMGTVVGTTRREGTPNTNNQYTVPAEGSVTFEPMSIAASIYGYFGVQNPQVMTASDGDAGDGRLEDGLS